MNAFEPWSIMILILLFLGSLVVVLHVVKHRFGLSAEVTRKVLHVVMGLVSLTFPWLFDAVWPVLVLSLASLAWMAALRWVPSLHQALGSVVSDVERDSHGEIYYPITVGLLFTLSQGDPLLYCAPMGFLAISDAAAALVGVRFGRRRYGIPKSLEGSAAFLGSAWGITFCLLMGFVDGSVSEILLAALIISAVATVIEAVAWSGLDNILVPLCGFFLLQFYLFFGLFTLVFALWLILASLLLTPSTLFHVKKPRRNDEITPSYR